MIVGTGLGHFPQVSGSNLNRRRFNLPEDFEGEVNLVIVAFQQVHQLDVDTWVPFARDLAAAYPEVRFYELPTIWRMNPIGRALLDGGMRAGIPSHQTREATITLYLDKEPFRRALAVPDEREIVVLLVTRDGTILTKCGGPYAPQKANALMLALEGQFAPRP
jgi:hypothetical protein